MTGLQEAFYIVALVYMGVSLLVIVVLLVAVIVIRKKITNLENMLKDKFGAAMAVGKQAGRVVKALRNFTGKNRKR